tara:strand:- start:1884 stop:2105 length:222 start_codon:yes stop_codon:yes gene_type:complete
MNKEPLICITLTESDYLEVRAAISFRATDCLIKSLEEGYEHVEGARLNYRYLDKIHDQFNLHYKNIIQARLKK